MSIEAVIIIMMAGMVGVIYLVASAAYHMGLSEGRQEQHWEDD